MLNSLKRFFEKRPVAPERRSDDDILVAICALFVEMARIDDEFTAAEMAAILDIISDHYGLSREHARDIVAEADRALTESVDLWQFADAINTNYDIAEKLEIVDMLWRIVYLDGKMDAHEHYLMSKLKHLLRLDHDQLIASKLKIKADMTGGDQN